MGAGVPFICTSMGRRNFQLRPPPGKLYNTKCPPIGSGSTSNEICPIAAYRKTRDAHWPSSDSISPQNIEVPASFPVKNYCYPNFSNHDAVQRCGRRIHPTNNYFRSVRTPLRTSLSVRLAVSIPDTAMDPVAPTNRPVPPVTIRLPSKV